MIAWTATACLVLHCPWASHGFYDFAGGEIILETTVSGGYDSNVFGRADSVDDFFASLAPTLSWIRSAGLSGINVSAGTNITRYAEHSANDFEDYFAQFSAGFPIPAESDISGSFSAGYHRRTRLDEWTFDRRETDTFTANINARYQAKPRIYLTSGYGYSDRRSDEFKTFTHSGRAGIGFTEILRHLDLSFNYRIRHSRLERSDAAREHLDHSVSANLTGPLMPDQWLPKVDVSFSLGYENSLPTPDTDRTRRRLTGSIGANWEARERTTVSARVSRDLDLTPDQLNTESTNANLSVFQGIGVKMSGNAFVGYRWTHFPDANRRQETLRAGAGLTRNLNRNWDAGTNYTYTKNITDVAFRDFDRHLVTIFVTHRF